jgi:hypothetical protein
VLLLVAFHDARTGMVTRPWWRGAQRGVDEETRCRGLAVMSRKARSRGWAPASRWLEGMTSSGRRARRQLDVAEKS